MTYRRSIVIPVHGETEILEMMVEGLISHLGQEDLEILLVHDKGLDSKTVVRDLESRFDSVKMIELESEVPKGAALKFGIEKATGEKICLLDADFSFRIDDVVRCFETAERESVSLVIGDRTHEESDSNREPDRNLASKFYNSLSRTLLGTGVSDHQSGLKVLYAEFAKSAIQRISYDGYVFDTILVKEATEAEGVQTIPVSYEDRKNSKVNKLIDGSRMFSNLLLESIERGSPFSKRLIKFVIVGGIGAIFNTFLLWILVEFGNLNYMISALIAIEATILGMFVINNIFTYQTTLKGENLLKGIFTSNLVRSLGIIVQLSLLYVFSTILGVHYLIANLIGIFGGFISNYIGETFFTWDEKIKRYQI